MKTSVDYLRDIRKLTTPLNPSREVFLEIRQLAQLGSLAASKRDRDIAEWVHANECWLFGFEDGDVELDSNTVVSEGDDNGAYVLAWKWIPFEDTPFDTTKKEDK